MLWWRVEPDEETENPYFQGFGALADIALPEEMKQECERARQERAQHGDGLSG